MISIYSVPAIIALAAKGVILYFSYGAKVQNFKTRLFTVAVIFSICLSIVEAVALAYGIKTDYRDEFGYAYFGFAILLLVTLIHLAILITFDNPRRYVLILVYGYAALLEYLLFFTPLLVAGFEQFKGYTLTRTAGPLHGLFEVFVIGFAITMMFLPFFGLSKRRPAQVRNQCKLWIAAAAPSALLSVTTVLLLHFKIRLFNSTVTLPLLFTLLLAAVGYAVHNRRLIELDFYIPWSRTRREKKKFYAHLSRFYVELTEPSSLQDIVSRLSAILKCPAALISSAKEIFIQAGEFPALEHFAKHELYGLDHMLVIDEIGETHPQLYALMKQHQAGAVVPFYPQSKHMASWLLLGENFCKQVYTPLDFKVVERLFEKLGHLLLDALVASAGQEPKVGSRTLKAYQGEIQEQINAKLEALLLRFDESRLDKSLDEHLSEVEALLLVHALKRCGGNYSQTARFLGLRANTLHYRLARYGLLEEKQK